MPKQCSKPKKYAKKYFLKSPPPNHNPLIGMLKDDTLCNVRNALYAIKELMEAPDFAANDYATNGYHMIVGCILSAINFELYHRK